MRPSRLLLKKRQINRAMPYLASCFLPIILLLAPLQQDGLQQRFQAAEANRRAGKLAAAEAEYVAILFEAYRKLGRIYSAEKDYKQATAALESAVQYKADSEEALLDLAISYFNAEQYDKAI